MTRPLMHPRKRWILPGTFYLVTASLASTTCAVALAEQCASKPRKEFEIVLDVGHSAREPGAISARGVPEYDFNLKLTRQIERALVHAGFHSTHVLVTSTTGPRGLQQRWMFANQRKADLLISVHHDSVHSGYLENWDDDGMQRQFSNRYRGYSLFLAKETAAYKESLRFAVALADALKAKGFTFTTHHAEDLPGERRPWVDAERGIYRNDLLAVLRNSDRPAVLFEAGVIVNRDEELFLASDVYRDAIAAAVTTAVAEFCLNRPGQN